MEVVLKHKLWPECADGPVGALYPKPPKSGDSIQHKFLDNLFIFLQIWNLDDMDMFGDLCTWMNGKWCRSCLRDKYRCRASAKCCRREGQVWKLYRRWDKRK